MLQEVTIFGIWTMAISDDEEAKKYILTIRENT